MADGNYRKVIHEFVITGYLKVNSTGDEYDLTDNFIQIAVKKDYGVNIFPLYYVKIQATNELRSIIKDNKCTLYVNINQFSVDQDDPDATDPVIENSVVSTGLRIFDHNLTELDEKPLSDDEEEDPISNQRFVLSLSCIPDDLMRLNDVVLNDVFENASIDDALVEILGDCNNVYIDPPDNKERYETLIIPPLNRSMAVKWLAESYGMYQSKYSLFFDTDATYLTKMYNHNSKSFLNSYDIEVIKTKDMDSTSNINKIEIDDDGNLRKYMHTAPTIISTNDVSSDAFGGTAIVGSYGSEYELDTRTYINSDNDKVRYFWNDKRDVIFEKEMFSIPRFSMSLVVSDLNPNLLSRKTRVNIRTYDEIYNGVYDVLSISSVYTTVNKSIFKCTSLITCAK